MDSAHHILRYLCGTHDKSIFDSRDTRDNVDRDTLWVWADAQSDWAGDTATRLSLSHRSRVDARLLSPGKAAGKIHALCRLFKPDMLRYIRRRERHYLPRRSDEAICAANGEMARIRQIVRKPMSFSLMF